MNLPVDVANTEYFWKEREESFFDLSRNNHTILGSEFNQENEPEDLVV
jgi:hypothetical protein